MAAASHNNYLCVLRSSPEDGCSFDLRSLDRDALLENRPMPFHHKYNGVRNAQNIAVAQIGSALVIAMGYTGDVHLADDNEEAEERATGSICLLVQKKGNCSAGTELVQSADFWANILPPCNIPEIGDSISIAFLYIDKNPQQFLLVSGHRDGTLVVWRWQMTRDQVVKLHDKPFHKKLGAGGVQVLVDPSNATAALISCDGLVHRLTSSKSSRYPELIKVGLPASNQPHVSLPSISILLQPQILTLI